MVIAPLSNKAAALLVWSIQPVIVAAMLLQAVYWGSKSWTICSSGLVRVTAHLSYALYLYRRVIFGIIEKPSLMHIADLSMREIVILAPLVVLTLYYGVHPQPIIDASAASAEALIKGFDQALALTKTAGL